MIRTLFTKKKFRWLQRVTGVHRIQAELEKEVPRW